MSIQQFLHRIVDNWLNMRTEDHVTFCICQAKQPADCAGDLVLLGHVDEVIRIGHILAIRELVCMWEGPYPTLGSAIKQGMLLKGELLEVRRLLNVPSHCLPEAKMRASVLLTT